MADLSASPYTGAAIGIIQVAAAAGNTFSTAPKPLCSLIVLHATGVLSYKDRNDVTVTTSIPLPAGAYPIEAQSILSGTTVPVTCLFFSGVS